jgi:hypothetical protein
MSSLRSRRPGRRKVHRLMRASRSSRKRPSATPLPAQVAVGAGDQLEVAADLAVAAEREKALLLDRAQQHRLLVEPSSPISSRNSRPPSAARSRPGRSLRAPVKAPRRWPNSVRHRAVAAQRRAVDLDEAAGELVALLLQLVHAARELDLPAPVGPISSIGARDAGRRRVRSARSAR